MAPSCQACCMLLYCSAACSHIAHAGDCGLHKQKDHAYELCKTCKDLTGAHWLHSLAEAQDGTQPGQTAPSPMELAEAAAEQMSCDRLSSAAAGEPRFVCSPPWDCSTMLSTVPAVTVSYVPPGTSLLPASRRVGLYRFTYHVASMN